MKPSNKISVPDVFDLFRKYYQKHKSWGPLSLVLLKANYKEAQFCYKEALKTNNSEHILMASKLLELTPTQRKKIVS